MLRARSSDSDAKTTTTRVEVIESSGPDGSGFDAKAIYKSEAPGVVTVISLFGASGGLDSLLDEGGEGGGGVGSGFVLNGDGEIATNAHVVTTGEGAAIRRARQVYVEFADGNQVEAKIVGADPNADIALLRIDPAGLRLRPLPLGDSADVEVGEPVAAIGSPFGERQSLSVGVVSAVDRSIESLTNFGISGAVQTDAAINPGNSGGPLVNGEGRVIGVNQQIKSTSGGGEGVGFAVPVDAVRRSLDMLREHGQARYAYLGVSAVELYPQLVDRFGLDVDTGAWVQQVNAGGPAERAGLHGGRTPVTFQAQSFRPGGDVISEVAGRPVQDSAQLAELIAGFDPGDEVPLEIHRNDDTKEIKVKLGERPLVDVGG
jgi:S1-C subfamily serine protease